MSFDEPHPEYHGPAIWPIWVTYLAALAIMWPVNLLTHTGWGSLVMLLSVAITVRAVVLVVIRSRRFDRESDAWMDRMNAYYDRRLARWN